MSDETVFAGFMRRIRAGDDQAARSSSSAMSR
jgi:hypothetical protein